MSGNFSFHSYITTTLSWGEDELLTESQARHSSKSGSTGSIKETEEGVGSAGPGGVGRLRREMKDLKGLVERQGVDMGRLRRNEQLMRECEHMANRIKELEYKVGSYQEDAQRRNQHILAMEERLKRTEELLATRPAELTGTQAFLPTTDHLLEAEVFGIVRDLNETIYQVAVDLTEEWEKLESLRATTMDFDPSPQPCAPVLVQLTRNRDSIGLTLLLQSCLCSQVVSMTSSWGHQGLALLESIYQRLSISGEHRRQFQVICDSHITEGEAISARWRSLAHSHLSRPPPDPTLLVEKLAKVLDHTGSFSSTKYSLDFVRTVALEKIETIIRYALHLESVFKVEITSSDMSLLFEPPGTLFDGGRMTNEFESCGLVPRARDRIAGTTEVGVGKSMRGAGKGRRTEILLRTKVVLEGDIMIGL